MKGLSTALLIALVLLGSLAGLVIANPYLEQYIALPSYVQPPSIVLTDSIDNCSFTSDKNLIIPFRLSLQQSDRYRYAIEEICYNASWLREETIIYLWESGHDLDSYLGNISVDLHQAPSGSNNVTIVVYGSYLFVHGPYADIAVGKSSASVTFTVHDISAPTVSVLIGQNQVFTNPNIPLNFWINERAICAYCLDSQGVIDVDGNTTLMGLTNGKHNLTVYANDTSGNVGSSNIQFVVAVPFPILAVATIATIIAVVSITLVLANKKGLRIKQ